MVVANKYMYTCIHVYIYIFYFFAVVGKGYVKSIRAEVVDWISYSNVHLLARNDLIVRSCI